MALIGSWGCFIHIPKTGGQWVRKVLRTTIETGKEDGPTHGFPIEHDPEKPYFSFVREPVLWYRSFWGHRVRDSMQGDEPGHFRRNANDSEAWNTLITMTLPFMDLDFDKFVSNVTFHFPGMYTWFVGFYYAPHVQMMCFEKEATNFLMSVGGDPAAIPPHNKGIDRMDEIADLWPEKISEESRKRIHKSEVKIYQRWYSD